VYEISVTIEKLTKQWNFFHNFFYNYYSFNLEMDSYEIVQIRTITKKEAKTI